MPLLSTKYIAGAGSIWLEWDGGWREHAQANNYIYVAIFWELFSPKSFSNNSRLASYVASGDGQTLHIFFKLPVGES